MSGQFWLFFIGIVLFTIVLFVLPFAPAWLEWKNKTDAEPFNVYFEDRGIVDYFLRIFREFIEIHFATLIDRCKKEGGIEEGVIDNKIEYCVTGEKGKIQLSNQETKKNRTNKVLVFCKEGILPAGIHAHKRIFALEDLLLESHAVVNEVVSKGKLTLNKDVSVEKLLASDKEIIIHEGCKINGFVRAKHQIKFLGDAQFQYLDSEKIEFGNSVLEITQKAVDVIEHKLPRLITSDSIFIPSNSNIASNYVSKMSLTIGKGSKIMGNLKVYDVLYIGENTVIQGAVFCESDIIIGENCTIQGPVVATGTVQIGKNCVIGSEDSNTSLIAHRIYILSGCVMKGVMLAKKEGYYLH